MNCAIIDIGSNSIRLMILCDGKPIFQETETTRLGQNLTNCGMIGEDEFHHSLDVIDMFCKRARNTHAFDIYIFGTATLRCASNSSAFCLAVFSRVGEKVKVLGGVEEAVVGYVGAVNGSLNPSVVVDVGGASTEIAVGTCGLVTNSQSVDIGVVRIFSKCGDSFAECEKYIDKLLNQILIPQCSLDAYAIGGTATSIAMLLDGGAKYDKEVTDGFVIEIEKLKKLSNDLFEMGQVGREKLLSIKKERREIIAGGALLLLKIMQKLEIDKIKASESDNLIGFFKVFVEKNRALFDFGE